MKALVCPQCSANIELDDTREYGFCHFCGCKIQLNETINIRYHVEYNGADSFASLEKKGLALCELGNWEKALEIFDDVLEKYPEEPLSYYDYIYAYTNGLKHSDFTLEHINEINEQYAKMQSIIEFSKKDPIEQHRKLERFIKDFEKELEAQRQRELSDEQERQRQYIQEQKERLNELLAAKKVYTYRPLKFSALSFVAAVILTICALIQYVHYTDTAAASCFFAYAIFFFGLAIACCITPLIRSYQFLGNKEIKEIQEFLDSQRYFYEQDL